MNKKFNPYDSNDVADVAKFMEDYTKNVNNIVVNKNETINKGILKSDKPITKINVDENK